MLRRHDKVRGFTLVELMVAIIIAAIVVLATYSIYAMSSDTYRTESQVAHATQSLRFGYERLRVDISKTGFLASTNTNADPAVCFNSAGRPIYGLAVRRDFEENAPLTTVFLPTSNLNVQPSAIFIFGDFWSRGAFQTLRAEGTTIVLDTTQYAGSTNPADIPTALEMTQWFRPGRMLRLANQGGRELYFFIVDFQPAGGGPSGLSPVITIDQPVPVVFAPGACGVQGFGSGVFVNPVGMYHYYIRRDPTPTAPADKYDLLRDEWDIANDMEFPGTQLQVAEYAVELQFYDFLFDVGTPAAPDILTQAGNFPDITTVVNVGGTGQLGNVGFAIPQQLRALTVKLTTRAIDEDPNLAFRPRLNRFAPITDGVELDPLIGGAARTVTFAGRIRLRNFP